MKFAHSLMLGACILALASCGGGGSTTAEATPEPTPATTPEPTPAPSPAPAPSAPSATGILSDSPVGGVQYVTSGGYSGVTSASGEYSYNPGETVTFRIGAITLGTVTATGMITPIQLAGTDAGSANKVTNLLILLQSLDADNDPSNGITINAATQAAAESAGSLDLAQSPAQFASADNAALTSILTGAGLPRTTAVDPAAALAHFEEQFFKQLEGAWIGGTNKIFTFRFSSTGEYIHGEAGPAEGGGMSGTEVGRIEWDPTNAKFSLAAGSLVFDSNGDWGVSNESGDNTLHFDGDDRLIVTDTDGTVTPLSRVANNAESLVGMWALGSETTIRTQTFTFLADGRYLMADPLGDTDPGGPSPCSDGGVEFGPYTFNTATGTLAVNQTPVVDTNSCAGLWDKPAGSGSELTGTFNADKTSFTFDGQTLYRVSR